MTEKSAVNIPVAKPNTTVNEVWDKDSRMAEFTMNI